jgi:predicted nucleic-acid-binding protein
LKIGVDTNVLVRALVNDDKKQSLTAEAILAEAESVMISSSALCELVWVLQQGYGVTRDEISRSIATLINAENVVVDLPAIEAGLAILKFGGDFADGIIAFESHRLGAEELVTFDRKAAKLLLTQGHKVQLL